MPLPKKERTFVMHVRQVSTQKGLHPPRVIHVLVADLARQIFRVLSADPEIMSMLESMPKHVKIVPRILIPHRRGPHVVISVQWGGLLEDKPDSLSVQHVQRKVG